MANISTVCHLQEQEIVKFEEREVSSVSAFLLAIAFIGPSNE
jgi:hypothetical protein